VRDLDRHTSIIGGKNLTARLEESDGWAGRK
jgi:hypothetical protein